MGLSVRIAPTRGHKLVQIFANRTSVVFSFSFAFSESADLVAVVGWLVGWLARLLARWLAGWLAVLLAGCLAFPRPQTPYLSTDDFIGTNLKIH